MPQKTTKQTPVETIRSGALKASIWKNKGQNGAFLKVTFSKTYSVDGEPKDTYSFDARDLLTLSDLAQHASRRMEELKPVSEPA